MLSFELLGTSSGARLGRLVTAHGEAATPLFMPVGTAGSVKGVTPSQLRAAAVQMVLANTYHLMLRPGEQTVAALGGLRGLMAWDGPILTDSGGYQVFSLQRLRKISDDGVVFQSHIDGAEVALTPLRAIGVQRLLGADIIMQLDDCPPGNADKPRVTKAVERTAVWARRCKEEWLAGGCRSTAGDPQALFGIQQGGVFDDLRATSAQRLVDLDLPGYAIGGLSVGEDAQAALRVLDRIETQLPADRPRYLMGVGEPRDILAAVLRGVDMFDCVIPTRNGRNAQAFTWHGRLRLRNAGFGRDTRPIDENCDCYTCSNFSRGALRHLFLAKEMLAATLTTIHNLRFFAQFMSEIRAAIRRGDLARRAASWVADMYGPEGLDSGQDAGNHG